MISNSNETLAGWRPEDGNRGSWSIVWSSVITIIACTWTVLHPRIHVDRKLRRLHKLCQLFKQILAPELETIEALQELLQARKAKACCAGKTNPQLNLTQSFYIGMMGIRYKTEIEGGHRVLWPLQYAFLLNNNIVSWPADERWGLAKDLIEDRSKADGLFKFFTLLQVTWFTINCIVRSAHDMALAPLESMTLAYVVQVLLTYVLWWKKPKDIATANFVDLPEMDPFDREVFDSLAMESTYDAPDPANTVLSKSIAWYIIPRDCGETDYKVAIEKAKTQCTRSGKVVSEVSQTDSVGHDISATTLPKSRKPLVSNYEFKRARPLADTELGHPVIKHGDPGNDKTKVVTEWDDSLYWTKWWPLVCLVGCSFGAVHMVSWNGHFATLIELWLWRTSCVGSIVFAFVPMQFKKVEFRWLGIRTIVQIGCPVLYVVCRLIMVAEVIAAFRALPESTYSEIDIANYWIHF